MKELVFNHELYKKAVASLVEQRKILEISLKDIVEIFKRDYNYNTSQRELEEFEKAEKFFPLFYSWYYYILIYDVYNFNNNFTETFKKEDRRLYDLFINYINPTGFYQLVGNYERSNYGKHRILQKS